MSSDLQSIKVYKMGGVAGILYVCSCQDNKIDVFFSFAVTLNGTYNNQKLIGFMLVAVPENAQDESVAMGTFQVCCSSLCFPLQKTNCRNAMLMLCPLHNVRCALHNLARCIVWQL